MSLFGRRERREIRDLNASVDRLRSQRDEARSERDTAGYNREQILRQLADASAANRRLYGRNLELGRRLAALAEADPEYAAALERRVARLLKVIARFSTGGQAEKQRADRLQQRLDDALGLNTSAVRSGSNWQETRQDKPIVKESTP